MIEIAVFKLTIPLLLVLFLSGCVEKTSQNPNEVYKLWSGTKPSSDVKIILDKYWKSAHRSKEYILYMEMKASKQWVEALVKQNNLRPDTTGIGIANHPDWFIPSKNFLIFRRENDPYPSRMAGTRLLPADCRKTVTINKAITFCQPF